MGEGLRGRGRWVGGWVDREGTHHGLCDGAEVAKGDEAGRAKVTAEGVE